ncbi:hypothetical protein N7474_002869 [Penicillium riverlandense]|uniref:uncharacterized protein n=1 Tax=Penicillium riverlandense TaxID=1903569 RepID=UPI0025487D7B|nr:uncharacterized protein N7474_002869 [Penicillium riverlandense]KAJ5825731.1 hypothetical protein N7474_002869 [Penicillium riverlandense]
MWEFYPFFKFLEDSQCHQDNDALSVGWVLPDLYALICAIISPELYELELVDEEAYEQWRRDERLTVLEEMLTVRAQAQQFVDWPLDP